MVEEHRVKRLNEFKELNKLELDQYLLAIDDIDVGNGARIKVDKFVQTMISSDEGNSLIEGQDGKFYLNNPSALNTYDEDTTYNAGDWVLGTVEGVQSVYRSLQDDNIGNSLLDDEYWEALPFGDVRWGNISGDITNQEDLQIALDAKLDASDKGEITGWAFPDYSAGVNISNGYTVEKQGWVNCITGGGGSTMFYVNGIGIANAYSGAGGDMLSAFVPVNKDDVVSATGNIALFKFYPLRGSEDVIL